MVDPIDKANRRALERVLLRQVEIYLPFAKLIGGAFGTYVRAIGCTTELDLER